MRLKTFLRISQIILVVSAIIDAYLWFTIKYEVPCFVVSGFSITFALILEPLRRVI